MKKEKLEQRKKIIMNLANDPQYRPMRLREIAVIMDIPKKKRKELYDVVDALVAEGRLESDQNGRYTAVKGDYVEGNFIGHAKGFGFVEVEGLETDIFIPETKTNTALHTDQVQVLLDRAPEEQQRKNAREDRGGHHEGKGRGGRRQEGTVVKVLERGLEEIVGTYQKNNNYGFVVPDNSKISTDIFIPREKSQGAATGDKVVAVITDYGSVNKNPEGKITEVLGSIHEPGTDILAIAKGYGIPTEFPEKVVRQAERVPEQIVSGDFEGRMDIRDWTVVTIDGEDAKDLDDGISLTKEETAEGPVYHLGVHIADVSNYVQENSALDREALKRGTSVYLVDRVIPMLPKRLSNGICSLNQGQDRLALSCLMDLNKNGKMLSHKIAETVICVDRRMTYTNVNKVITDQDPKVMREYEELVLMFQQMAELSAILRKKRHRRGSIDFDFPESKILLDGKGKPVEIKAYETNAATKLIEDFMLLANETVARDFSKRSAPFLYRTHENPDPDRIEELLTLLRNQGIKAAKAHEEIRPKEIQRLLESIEDLPNEPMISRMTLRTMKQAKYTTDCSGHFGLAARYYCHFTSPIRRYPDLQIHRIIKDYLRGRLKKEKKEHYGEILDGVAQQSSAMERRAEEAERESNKLKKAEYMQAHIGETFEGIISGVTGWGLYVELPNTIEGLVHVNTMRDDFYNFDEEHYEMVGEATKKTYRLGQQVTVRVADADSFLKTVDFTLTGERDSEEDEQAD